jgi:hypothetical protein
MLCLAVRSRFRAKTSDSIGKIFVLYLGDVTPIVVAGLKDY